MERDNKDSRMLSSWQLSPQQQALGRSECAPAPAGTPTPRISTPNGTANLDESSLDGSGRLAFGHRVLRGFRRFATRCAAPPPPDAVWVRPPRDRHQGVDCCRVGSGTLPARSRGSPSTSRHATPARAPDGRAHRARLRGSRVGRRHARAVSSDPGVPPRHPWGPNAKPLGLALALWSATGKPKGLSTAPQESQSCTLECRPRTRLG
jgi:hypothetical protein